MTTVELKIAAGVIKDNTRLLAENRWVDSDKIRFRRVGDRSMPEVIGGYEDLSEDTFEGKCRALHVYESLDGRKVIAAGTNSHLYAYINSTLHDITPIRILGTLTNAISTVSGSAIISISHSSHGLNNEDKVYLRNTAVIGGVSLGLNGTFASNLTASIGSTSIVITQTAHGMNTGDLLSLAAANGFAGIPVGELNKEHTVYRVNADQILISSVTKATSDAVYSGNITYTAKLGYTASVTNANAYSIIFGSNASATTPSAGGSLTFSYVYGTGKVNSANASGYGSGGYSEGYYSLPSDETDFEARQWSLSHFQGQLVANYKSSPLFTWGNVPSERATRVSESATDCPSPLTFFTTPENFIVALGGANNIYNSSNNTSSAGTTNPLRVQWAAIDSGLSDVTGSNVQFFWSPKKTNSSGDFLLSEGNRVIGAAPMSFVSLIWTDTACYQIQYVPEVETVYRPTLLAVGAGLLSKNAWARAGNSTIYWLSSSREFMLYNGGAPTTISCPMRDFFFDGLAEGQEALISAGTNDTYNEVTWWYPTDETNECARYLTLNFAELVWYLGTSPITSWAERGVESNPIAAYADGTLKIQEYGNTANGSAFTAFLESGWMDLQDGHTHSFIKRYTPDFQGLSGGVNVSVLSKEWPQAATVTTTNLGAINATTEKVDTRISGRQIAIRYDWNSSPTDGRLGKILFDVTPTQRTR
jgi:hypothetical protein